MNVKLKLILATFIFALSIASYTTNCPLQCVCTLDAKGRRTVECNEGGMSGALSLQNISKDIEVLKIIPPEDNTNDLTMTPELQSFKKLEEVHITKSNIPILGQYFFYGLSKLNILNLSQNNITQPLDKNFKGLYNLKELYLDDNRIYSLPSGTFRYLAELRLLSLQRNRIKMIPRMFQGLEKLRVLKLSGNNLRDLEATVFEDIKELQVFECRSCGLEFVNPNLYKTLNSLTHLDLGENQIAGLDQHGFKDLPELRTLKLDRNHLTEIHNYSFIHLNELKTLNLTWNKIRHISPDAFKHLKNLTEIDLSNTGLERLDATLFRPVFATLETLILNGNMIPYDVLGAFLYEFKNLRELHLCKMGLLMINSEFIPDSVNVLLLSGNSISYFPPNALPKNLIELDISRNNFRGLDEEIMRRVEHIPKLKLDGNPWSCDLCHIKPLLNRARSNIVIYNLVCKAPYSLKDEILGKIHIDDLSWCNSPSYASGDANFFLTNEDGKLGVIAAGASVILLTVTVFAILGALCYSRRHAAKYYTHEEKRVPDNDPIFDTQNSPLFGDERELTFKFPLDVPEKKVSIATIDEIKKEHNISNGT